MNNELEVFQDILFISCPWQLKEESEHKYIQDLQEIPKELAGGFGLYEIKFAKPLSARRKYYYRIIENEALNYLNQTHALMANASAENEKKYIVDKVLSKRLNTKLYEVAKVIAVNNLTYDLIKQTTLHSNQNPKFKEDAFIIQFLKYQLLWLYLEIQDTYTDFVTNDIYTKEELHQKFFDYSLDADILHRLPQQVIIIPSSSAAKTIEREPLEVHKGDFRLPQKGILRFETIINNPGRFLSFEEDLYAVGLINHKLSFTNQHTQKQYLAAVYHALIKKQYFRKRNFEKLKDIKDVSIRKFLDHRYNADVDAQFRYWDNNRDKLADYLHNYPWIAQLPTS